MNNELRRLESWCLILSISHIIQLVIVVWIVWQFQLQLVINDNFIQLITLMQESSSLLADSLDLIRDSLQTLV